LKEKEYIVSLSHWINEETPVYGNKGGFKRKKLSSIENGDSANSEYWEFNNHIGTHIDFPNIFVIMAKHPQITRYPIFGQKKWHC